MTKKMCYIKQVMLTGDCNHDLVQKNGICERLSLKTKDC